MIQPSAKSAFPAWTAIRSACRTRISRTSQASSRTAARRTRRAMRRSSVDLPDAERAQARRGEVRAARRRGRRAHRSSVPSSLPIRPQGPVIGVKKLFEDLGRGRARPISTSSLVTPEGRRIAKPQTQWSLDALDKRYQWFNQDGRWSFEPVSTTRKVADGSSISHADGAAPHRGAGGVGRPTASTCAAAPDGGDASVASRSAGPATPRPRRPTCWTMSLDKASLRRGRHDERPHRRPVSRARRRVAVISDKLRDLRRRRREGRRRQRADPRRRRLGRRRLCRRARAFRPLDAAAKRMPGRAIGLAWFGIDQAAHQLEVSLGTGRRCGRAAPLEIPVELAGLAPGEEAYVTVAAVDVGILNLTRYEPPKPADYYLRPAAARRRGARSLRLPDRRHAGRARRDPLGRRRRRPAGDAIPPTQEPVARYSGVVKVGAGRHGDRLLRHPRLQRHGARHGRRLDARAGSAAPRRT